MKRGLGKKVVPTSSDLLGLLDQVRSGQARAAFTPLHFFRIRIYT